MSAFLDRFFPCVALIALVLGVLVGWHFGASSWKTQYETLSAENWQDRAQRAEAALADVQGQLKDAKTTISHNAGVLNDYEQKLAATAAERDQWRASLDRMRAAQARLAATGGNSLSEADCRCGAVEARAASELAECESVLVENIAEGDGNAAQLDALIKELRPQL